jgi:hypothetical protein
VLFVCPAFVNLISDIYLGLRVEWAMSRACAERWSEEVQLSIEEMHHVLCFLLWWASWWLQQSQAHVDVTEELGEGLSGYAAKQAATLWKLARLFADTWYGLHAAYNITPEWPTELLQNHAPTAGPLDCTAVYKGYDDDDMFEDDIFD